MYSLVIKYYIRNLKFSFGTVYAALVGNLLYRCPIKSSHRAVVLQSFKNFETLIRKRRTLGEPFDLAVILTSGGVQGSCLGPLLFLIYINDLTQSFYSTATPKLYADDLKLYATLTCNNDEIFFRKNLEMLSNSSKTWQLPISINKISTLLLDAVDRRRQRPK